LYGGAFTDSGDPDLAGNQRCLSFYTLADDEITPDRAAIVDAFGNTEIAVLWDRNGDGQVDHLDGELIAVHGPAGEGPFTPGREAIDLEQGVRAGVLFYSAGQGRDTEDLVLSWK
jgi:hypothetical protein